MKPNSAIDYMLRKKTNWRAIERRAKKAKTAIDYMKEHPLTHEQAVEQTKRLKNLINKK